MTLGNPPLEKMKILPITNKLLIIYFHHGMVLCTVLVLVSPLFLQTPLIIGLAKNGSRA